MIYILLKCLYRSTFQLLGKIVRVCDHFNNVADQHEKYNAVTKSMQSAVMLLFLNSIGRHIAKKLLRLKKLLINDDSDSDSDSNCDSDFEVLSGPSDNR